MYSIIYVGLVTNSKQIWAAEFTIARFANRVATLRRALAKDLQP